MWSLDARAITVRRNSSSQATTGLSITNLQHDFFERLGTPIKEKHILAGFYHDTLGERIAPSPSPKVRDFVLRRFAEPRPFVDLARLTSTADARRIGRTGVPLPH